MIKISSVLFGWWTVISIVVSFSAFAEEGFKAPEQIFGASGFGSVNTQLVSFDPLGRAFSSWQPAISGIGGFAIRENGPMAFKVIPGAINSPVTFQFDEAGNAVLAWISPVGANPVALNVAYRKAGVNSPITNVQSLGKVTNSPSFDLHMTGNGLAAIGWYAATNFVPNGIPKIAFRGPGDSALFDSVDSAIAIDTEPSSSGAMVGVAREPDGAAYAIWKKDTKFRESFKPANSATFSSAVDIALAVPLGATPPGQSQIGGVLSFKYAKNKNGKGAVAYNQPNAFNPGDVTETVSAAAAIREPGGLLGTHTLFNAGVNTQNAYSDIGVLPDGTVVTTWAGKTYGNAGCPPNLPPPHITGTNTALAVHNGSWVQNIIVSSAGTTFAGTPRVAVADGRAIVYAERVEVPGPCGGALISRDVLFNAPVWPSGSLISQGQNFSEPTLLMGIFWLGVSDQGRMLALKSGMSNSIFAVPFENGSLDFSGGNIPTPTATPMVPLVETPIPGIITLSGKSYKSKKGSVAVFFNCTGESGASCSGEVELFTTLKFKKGTKVTIKKRSYGTCAVSQFFVPAKGTCALKLNSAAKKIIRDTKKLKATVALRSEGVATESKTSVTIR